MLHFNSKELKLVFKKVEFQIKYVFKNHLNKNKLHIYYM